MNSTGRGNGLAWVAVCAVVALATACGGSSSPSESSAAASSTAAESSAESSQDSNATAEGPAIVMEGMSFGDPITVAPGATIQLVNNDMAEHSVTSDTEGLFDVHVDGEQTGTLTAPTEPGEYTYYCIYHPGMKGTLIVS